MAGMRHGTTATGMQRSCQHNEIVTVILGIVLPSPLPRRGSRGPLCPTYPAGASPIDRWPYALENFSKSLGNLQNPEIVK